MFFNSSPNLPDHEKARIEFHLQQLAECIGPELLRKPVLIPDDTFGHSPLGTNIDEVLTKIGRHLEMDTHPITVVVQPKALEVCGGGG